MLHKKERKEKDHSKIFILHERWVSFILKDFHNIIDNFTFIIIYNIVQHHLNDLTSFFSTSFQVTYAKIMIIVIKYDVRIELQIKFLKKKSFLK